MASTQKVTDALGPNRQGGSVVSRVARLSIPPIGAWLFARLIVTVFARNYSNVFDFRAFPWIRIDSFNYLSIARHGRTFGHCPRYWQLVGHAKWCGTAAWLPGYPDAIRVVSKVTTLSLDNSGVLLSNAFAVGTLTVIWIGLLVRGPLLRSMLVLALFAIFPGAVYTLAVFPISMALFGIAASVVAFKYERPVLACVALLIATAAYPSALYVIPVAMGALWLTAPQGKRLLRTSLGLIPFVPFVYLFIHDQMTFGHWNAYMLLQNEAGPSLFPPKDPISEIWHLVFTRDSLSQQLNGHSGAQWIAVQFVWASALVLGGLVVLFLRRRQEATSVAAEAYPAVLAAAVWAGLLFGGVTGAWYRGIAIAAPAALAARKLPTWAIAVVVALTAVVTAAMSHYFFSRIGLNVK